MQQRTRILYIMCAKNWSPPPFPHFFWGTHPFLPRKALCSVTFLKGTHWYDSTSIAEASGHTHDPDMFIFTDAYTDERAHTPTRARTYTAHTRMHTRTHAHTHTHSTRTQNAQTSAYTTHTLSLVIQLFWSDREYKQMHTHISVQGGEDS